MSSVFSHADHDRVLSAYATPKWLVASKPYPTSDQILGGSAANLRHHYWIIRSDDPDKVREADVPVDFHQPVHPGGIRITDSHMASNLLTAKIVAIEMMRGQYMDVSTALPVLQAVRQILWIVRWRLALGVPAMQKLSPSLFNLYCESRREDFQHSSLWKIASPAWKSVSARTNGDGRHILS